MDQPSTEIPVIEETSLPYVGRWNRLVSTTNWEKGRIIHEWRSALIASGAPATEYSDDAWSRIVGGLSGQHIGRLRRVYERFGAVYQDYEGLYWSHFQAALDWDDAEMWLEGAIQNNWSVSQMRRSRWESLGAVAGSEPTDADLEPSGEDFVSIDLPPGAGRSAEAKRDDSPGPADAFDAEPRSPAGPDFGDQDDAPGALRIVGEELASAGDAPIGAESAVAPFANLPVLPPDMAEAFEAFQLSILRHKAKNWHEVGLEDVLECLDALKLLAQSPSPCTSPAN